MTPRASDILREKREEYREVHNEFHRLRTPFVKRDNEWLIGCMLLTVVMFFVIGQPIIQIGNKIFWTIVLIWSIYKRQYDLREAKFLELHGELADRKYKLYHEVQGLRQAAKQEASAAEITKELMQDTESESLPKPKRYNNVDI